MLFRKKFVSWAGDVSKFLPVNLKGMIKDVGYVFFHDIVRNSDGKILAIGEQFRKQTSASGVAVKMMGGSASTAEMRIEDLMVFEFDEDFTLENVNVIEKTRSRVNLPDGAGLNGPQILSYYVKAVGGFDFEFLQYNKEKSIITVGYLDWVKKKGEKNRWKFGTVTYTDSKPVEDIVELNYKNTNGILKVYPGKPGHFMKLEYSIKEKKLEFLLEKINY